MKKYFISGFVYNYCDMIKPVSLIIALDNFPESQEDLENIQKKLNRQFFSYDNFIITFFKEL